MVQVFVDDAVRGDLPMVCVKTGAPTNRFVQHRGSAGTRRSWLLFFVIGIWALLFSTEETFDVFLPLHEDASRLEAERRRDRRMVWAATAAGVLLLVLFAQLGGADTGPVFLLVVAVSIVGTVVTSWRLGAVTVGVTLDATRRWVVLDGVHPAFVRAVEAERQSAR